MLQVEVQVLTQSTGSVASRIEDSLMLVLSCKACETLLHVSGGDVASCGRDGMAPRMPRMMGSVGVMT
jgi:hypothetical protein